MFSEAHFNALRWLQAAQCANRSVVLLKAFNDGWEFSVTHPTHEKHYGSGSEAAVLPPWHQSVIQPQWTFSGNRDHYSLSY